MNSSDSAMSVVAVACSVLGIGCGVLGSLMLLVLLLAGSPNSTPRQLRAIKWLMCATAVGALLSAGGGVWLLMMGRPWAGMIVGGLPMACTFGVLVYASMPGRR